MISGYVLRTCFFSLGFSESARLSRTGCLRSAPSTLSWTLLSPSRGSSGRRWRRPSTDDDLPDFYRRLLPIQFILLLVKAVQPWCLNFLAFFKNFLLEFKMLCKYLYISRFYALQLALLKDPPLAVAPHHLKLSLLQATKVIEQFRFQSFIAIRTLTIVIFCGRCYS